MNLTRVLSLPTASGFCDARLSTFTLQLRCSGSGSSLRLKVLEHLKNLQGDHGLHIGNISWVQALGKRAAMSPHTPAALIKNHAASSLQTVFQVRSEGKLAE